MSAPSDFEPPFSFRPCSWDEPFVEDDGNILRVQKHSHEVVDSRGRVLLRGVEPDAAKLLCDLLNVGPEFERVELSGFVPGREAPISLVVGYAVRQRGASCVKEAIRHWFGSAASELGARIQTIEEAKKRAVDEVRHDATGKVNSFPQFCDQQENCCNCPFRGSVSWEECRRFFWLFNGYDGLFRLRPGAVPRSAADRERRRGMKEAMKEGAAKARRWIEPGARAWVIDRKKICEVLAYDWMSGTVMLRDPDEGDFMAPFFRLTNPEESGFRPTKRKGAKKK